MGSGRVGVAYHEARGLVRAAEVADAVRVRAGGQDLEAADAGRVGGQV